MFVDNCQLFCGADFCQQEKHTINQLFDKPTLLYFNVGVGRRHTNL